MTRCDYGPTYDWCKHPEQHEGFKHAESWQEAEQALAAGEKVYDRDGDQVVKIHPLGPNEFPITSRTYSYTAGIVQRDDPVFLLVPSEPPVTDDEVAAAIQSITNSITSN